MTCPGSQGGWQLGVQVGLKAAALSVFLRNPTMIPGDITSRQGLGVQRAQSHPSNRAVLWGPRETWLIPDRVGIRVFGEGSSFMLKECSFGLGGGPGILGKVTPSSRHMSRVPRPGGGRPFPLGTHSSPHHLSMSFPCSPASPFPSHPQLVSRMNCLVQGEERIVDPLSYSRTDL